MPWVDQQARTSKLSTTFGEIQVYVREDAFMSVSRQGRVAETNLTGGRDKLGGSALYHQRSILNSPLQEDVEDD